MTAIDISHFLISTGAKYYDDDENAYHQVQKLPHLFMTTAK